jgi:hypothetical protein
MEYDTSQARSSALYVMQHAASYVVRRTDRAPQAALYKHRMRHRTNTELKLTNTNPYGTKSIAVGNTVRDTVRTPYKHRTDTVRGP